MSDEYENPLDRDDADDGLEIGEGVADGLTTEEVREQMKPKRVPLGRNDFLISIKVTTRDTDNNPCEGRHLCFEQDEETGLYDISREYQAMEIEIFYALASNPDLTMQFGDKFRLPPSDPDQYDLYMNAANDDTASAIKYKREPTPVKDRRSSNGFWWKKCKLMVNALGHEDGPDGTLSPTARNLRDWKYWPDGSPRLVSLEIKKQSVKDDLTGKWGDKLDQDGNPYIEVKRNSYQRSQDTLARLGRPAPEPKPKAQTKRELAETVAAREAPKPAPAPSSLIKRPPAGNSNAAAAANAATVTRAHADANPAPAPVAVAPAKTGGRRF